MDSKTTDRITLEYLMNPEMYRKYKKDKIDISGTEYLDERNFYAIRILNLTKEMLKGSRNEKVEQLFNEYCKGCIDYFKFIDSMEIYQSEYTNLVEDNSKDLVITDISYDNYLLKKQPLTMKKFINIKNTETVYMPKGREIDLKSEKYKTKGVLKKQNISNIYQDNVKHEKSNKDAGDGKKKANKKIQRIIV